MREPDHTRRVVITGLGIVSPIGNTVGDVWTSLTEGRSGIAQITHWDPTPYAPYVVAGEVKDFDVTQFLDAKQIRRTGPEIHWGVAAAKAALRDSGLEITDANREEVGVVFGSGAGGQGLFIENQMSWKEKGPRTVAPTFIAHGLVDSTSGMIAIESGAVGHNLAVVSACATGTHALGEAAEAIKRGDVTAVIAGSTENPLLEVAHIGFMNMRGLAGPRDGEGPASACRPYDVDRAGFVLGEGAGAFIVEDLASATARGATIYAEVVGYGSSADAHDMIQPIEGGAGSARSIKWALQRGKIDPTTIDLINPHQHARGRRARGARLSRRLRCTRGRDSGLRHQVADRPPDGCRRCGRGGLHDPLAASPGDSGNAPYQERRPSLQPERQPRNTLGRDSRRGEQQRWARWA